MPIPAGTTSEAIDCCVYVKSANQIFIIYNIETILIKKNLEIKIMKIFFEKKGEVPGIS